MRRRQQGAAAVEMALFMLLLMALLAVVWPLVGLMIEQVKLGRSAGTAAAFASSVPDHRRQACTGDRLATRSPSAADVEAEARCARFGTPDGGVGDMSVSVVPDPAAPTTRPGDEVTVTLERTVSLGPIGVFFDRPEVTLQATVVGVKE